ncbi:MAG: LamG-like jellyroll fold domain-containing protein [Planctomycetota bacterium]|jgi:parallel beta-helix repeat protein
MVMFFVVWVIVSIITGQTVFLEASEVTYIAVDDMEDYNDRDDIREVWRDGNQGGSSGSNLNVSTAVGSPFNGATGPTINDQAMFLRYDNDGMTYTGLPGDEKPMYPVPYYSEIEANTVGNNSLNIGQNWSATGCTELSLWFQGHPISDGDYDANGWPGYTLIGRGRDIGGRHDEFYFLSQYPFVGNGSIQLQVYDMDNTDPWAKAGVMIREKLTPYSKFAAVFMTPGNGVVFQYRDVEDGPTTSITKPGVSAPQHVRLVRNINDTFEAKHSPSGFVWQDVNAPGNPPVFPEIAMGETNLYAGTAVTSHNANQICTVDFNNVLISPLPPNWIFGNIGTNDPEQLYVALYDGVNTSVVEHNDASAATLTSWQEWKIPLTAFTGVDFSNIKKVYIGLGDRDNPVVGGSGTVYIDEIYLSGIPVGETYHVDGVNGDDNNGGLTPGTAFATIQKGIDTTIDGDTVIVYPDRYTENINFLGKNITVTSTSPDDPNVVASTIIQGTGAGPVVTFSGSESQSCVLDGLTITGGNTTGDGGGINGNGTEATIANCVITNNHADGAGGGVSNSNGRIVRCTITGNTAGGGGGDGGGGIYVYDCHVTIEDCDINNNTAADDGGGLCFYGSPGSTITRCTISDNDAIGSGADGGGIFVLGVPPILIEDCRIIRNSADGGGGGVYLGGLAGPIPGLIQARQCLITDNTAGERGGGISCEAQIEPRISNCTIADNQVTGAAGVGYGGGLNCSNWSNVEVINSIIWSNFAEQGFQVAVRLEMPGPSTLALYHSDVEGGPGGAYVGLDCTLDWGIGAIDSDPQLVDPNGGDWHLGVGSPCIDAGDNTAVPPSLTDLDGNPRIVNYVIDMGAYEFQGPFKRHYHVDGVNGDNTNDGLSRETAFATIQFAIDGAIDSDTILVWPGVYNETATNGINFMGKAITVKNAADAAVLEVPGFVAVTFIQGEDGNSVFSNFVLRGSTAGIFALFANPTINNVTVVGNNNGVIADNANPLITNSIFWNNINGDLFGSPDPITAQHSWVEDEQVLVAYWKLDGDAADSAGTNDGIIYGATSINGFCGQALYFDGDDYVEVPDSPQLDLTGDFTIQAWVNIQGTGGGPLVSKHLYKADNAGSWHFGKEVDDKLSFKVFPPGTDIQFKSDTTTFDSIWNHVAVTYLESQDFYAFYVNGEPSGSGTAGISGIIQDTSPNLQIGGAVNNPEKIIGNIDEVRIYGRGLSSEEIEALYTTGLAGQEYWPLFADVNNGDYHLLSERGRYRATTDEWILDEVTSPCVDGGDPNVNPSSEPMPNGGRINMGAYGNTAYASMSEWPIKGDVDRNGRFNLMDIALLLDEWLEELGWAQ